jgi:hypothetical protein
VALVPYDPVVSNVRLKNLGNQRPQTMPGIIVLIVARGSGPRPFAPYEVHYFVYEPLNPGEDHVYQIALTPPLPVVSRLLPGFFACVWGIAQLDNGGYSLFIWPQEYQGRFATGESASTGPWWRCLLERVELSAHGKLNDRPGTRTPIHGALRTPKTSLGAQHAGC